MKEIRKTIVYELEQGDGVTDEFKKQEQDGWKIDEWRAESGHGNPESPAKRFVIATYINTNP